MAKGQKRSNRETKKPKSDKKKQPAAAPSLFASPTPVKGSKPARAVGSGGR